VFDVQLRKNIYLEFFTQVFALASAVQDHRKLPHSYLHPTIQQMLEISADETEAKAALFDHLYSKDFLFKQFSRLDNEGDNVPSRLDKQTGFIVGTPLLPKRTTLLQAKAIAVERFAADCWAEYVAGTAYQTLKLA